MFRFNQGITSLHYESADVCSGSTSGKKTSTHINFLCDRNGNKNASAVEVATGSKLNFNSVSWDKCEYTFDFSTVHACRPRTSESCLFTDEASGKAYDLSQLKRSAEEEPWNAFEVDAETGVNKYRFFMDLCSPIEGDKGCDGNFVCQTDPGDDTFTPKGLGGSMQKPTVKVDSTTGVGKISVLYIDGAMCHTVNQGRQTKVDLICDTSVPWTTGPRFISEETCFYLFEWNTPAACPLGEEAVGTGGCQLESSGHMFDLSSLAKTYEVSSPDGTYKLNVCQNLDAKCGNRAGGAGVCKDGKSYGKASSKLEGISSGVKLIYSDAASECPSDNSKTLSTVINFVCPPTEGEQGNQVTFEAVDGCTTIFRFSTKLACIAPALDCQIISPDGAHTYDLSSLVQSGQENYMVTDNDGTNFHINVCRRLTTVEGCPADAAVCKTKEGGSSVSLGGRASPEWDYSESSPVIKYRADGGSCEATIKFKCPRDGIVADGSGPRLQQSANGGCKAEFVWITEAACPLSYKAGTDCVVDGRDFSLLRDDGAVTVEALNAFGSPYTYMFGICKKISSGAPSECKNKMACQSEGKKGERNVQSWDLGSAPEGVLYEYKGVPRVWYKGGTKCHGGTDKEGFDRSAIIEFKCDPRAGKGQVEFVDESDQCSYLFNWKTALACKDEVQDSCTVADWSGQNYDLSALKNHNNNWAVNDGDGGTYEFNVCRSLVPFSDDKWKCDLSQGACLMNSDHDGTHASLGGATGPQWDSSRSKVYLEFQSGQVCGNTGQPKSTRIYMSCPQSSSGPIAGRIGTPQFESRSDDGCVTQLTWDTSAACPVGKATLGSHCKVTDSVGTTYDLSPLVGKTFSAESGEEGTSYKVAVCGDVDETGECASSAACQTVNSKKNSMGKLDQQLEIRGDKLSLEYTGGTACHDSKFKRHTRIDFICDNSIADAADAKLIFAEEFSNCTYFFQMHTPLACSSIEEQVDKDCTVKDDSGSVIYDLSQLKRTGSDSNYIPSDADEGNLFKYFINVCHSLTSTSDYQNYQCDGSQGVCQVELNTGDGGEESKIMNLGRPGSPYVDDDDGKLKIKYTGGTECSNGDVRESVIEFVCDDTAGYNSIPQVMGEQTHCSYKFVWNTPYACSYNSNGGGGDGGGGGGGKYNTDDDDDTSVGNILDKSSCSDMLGNLGAKETVPGNDLFLWFTTDGDKAADKYNIHPCGTISSCGDGYAAICLMPQKENTNSHVSLGEFRNKPRIDSNGNTVIVYTNGDKCPSPDSADVPATSEITYKCSSKDDTAPSFEGFVGENNQCIYKFTWETKAACSAAAASLNCLVEGKVGQYDLKQLSVDSKIENALNWEVENSDGKAIVINICSNLIEGDSWVLAPCYGAAICIDGQPAGYLGEEPSANGNDEYKLWYPNPSAGDNCGTEIVFFCERGSDGVPTLQQSLYDCYHTVHWGTSIVCDAQAEPSVGDKCVVQSDVNGKYFDLSMLKNADTGTTGITLCQVDQEPADWTPSECDGAGVCVDGESFGKYNTKLTFFEDGGNGDLSLHYENGGSCSSGGKKHSKIQFLCDPSSGLGSPTLISGEGCYKYYQWHTAYACSNQNAVECFVTGPDKESYDLTPLSRQSGDSWAAEQAWSAIYQYKYVLNVCRDLTEPVVYTGSDCRGAAACQIDASSESAVKLGYAQQRIEVNNDGDLLMVLVNGDPCSNGKARQTTVKFHCNKAAGAGTPVFKGEGEGTKKCQYEIDRETQFACPLVDEDPVADCDSTDFPGLAVLGDAGPIEWTQDGLAFEFALCNAKKRKCGSGRQGACVNSGDAWLSLGKSTGVEQFGSDLSYNFKGGASCAFDSTRKRSATVDFECSQQAPYVPGTSHPVLVNVNQDCDYQFVWRTSLACGATVIPCAFYNRVDGRTYDLEPLQIPDTDITVLDNDDHAYYTNVCKSAVTPGCPTGAAACTKTRQGDWVALGMINANTGYEDENHEVHMHYDGGTCPSGGTAKMQIHYKCGSDVGKMELLKTDNCLFEFEWKTCLMCQDKNACGGAVPTVPPNRITQTSLAPHDNSGGGGGGGDGGGSSDNNDSSAGGGDKAKSGKGKTVFGVFVLIAAISMTYCTVRNEERRAWALGLCGFGGTSGYDGYRNPNAGYTAPMLGSDDEDDPYADVQAGGDDEDMLI